jgi:N-acylglucosamine 2-epimerase
MNYTNEDINQLREFYYQQLTRDTVPFWFPRSFDKEYGGFLLMRDHDGSLLDDDKAVWIQGRATWMLSSLYNTVEQKAEWLEGAKLGYDFLKKHCFDTDGRMYFHVTRDGKPIRKRRYFFSETFAAIAFAAYAKATGDEQIAVEAREIFGKCIHYASTPGVLPPKFTALRGMKAAGVPIIMINTAQMIRETIGDPRCDEWIDKWIDELERDFVKHDIRCVMEQVNQKGEISDHFDGRLLNPGHAIEGGWFILHEAIYRNHDARLLKLGLSMIDYMWERGWDTEHGGLYSFRDVYNKPVQEYSHDMKFWWPHNEAIIATLLAWTLTKDEKYAQWHKQVHDYAYSHFHDKEHGEWFGYLHKDGRKSVSLKGNLFKGPFHLPRQELYCYQLLSGKQG